MLDLTKVLGDLEQVMKSRMETITNNEQLPQLNSITEKLANNLNSISEHSIVVNNENRSYVIIPIEKIEYIVVFNDKLNVHVANNLLTVEGQEMFEVLNQYNQLKSKKCC